MAETKTTEQEVIIQKAITKLREKYTGLESMTAQGEFLVCLYIYKMTVEESYEAARRKVASERMRYLMQAEEQT